MSVGETGRSADPDELKPVLRAVERAFGLAATPVLRDRLDRSLGASSAERAVALHRLAHLPSDHGDWAKLVEELLNHETYCMRDPAQFRLLTELLPDLIARADADGSCLLRAWSAGCATGEEAYSIALVLLLALIRAGKAVEFGADTIVQAPWRIEVVASDLSRTSLEVARRGIYRVQALSAFRRMPASLLRFFPFVPGSNDRLRSVHPTLRKMIAFEYRNIAKDAPPHGPFDIVVCRNVAFYLTDEAQAAVVRTLRENLGPSGLLLVGPTDFQNGLADMEPIWSTKALIYRRGRDQTTS